jgi:hypothetical protein
VPHVAGPPDPLRSPVDPLRQQGFGEDDEQAHNDGDGRIAAAGDRYGGPPHDLPGPGQVGHRVDQRDEEDHCTPGYYNNEGHPPSPAARYNLGHPRGPHAFFRYMEEWREAGTFDGLEFR